MLSIHSYIRTLCIFQLALRKRENWPRPAYAQVSSFIQSQEKSLDHSTRAIQGSPDWGTTDLGWHPYLINVWQAAASRITGDTTSWVAWRDVGHLWVQAVSQVKSAEVCGELRVHTYTTYTQMVSMSGANTAAATAHSHQRLRAPTTSWIIKNIIKAIYGRKMVDALITKAWTAMLIATVVVRNSFYFCPTWKTIHSKCNSWERSWILQIIFTPQLWLHNVNTGKKWLISPTARAKLHT